MISVTDLTDGPIWCFTDDWFRFILIRTLSICHLRELKRVSLQWELFFQSMHMISKLDPLSKWYKYPLKKADRKYSNMVLDNVKSIPVTCHCFWTRKSIKTHCGMSSMLANQSFWPQKTALVSKQINVEQPGPLLLQERCKSVRPDSFALVYQSCSAFTKVKLQWLSN